MDVLLLFCLIVGTWLFGHGIRDHFRHSRKLYEVQTRNGSYIVGNNKFKRLKASGLMTGWKEID